MSDTQHKWSRKTNDKISPDYSGKYKTPFLQKKHSTHSLVTRNQAYESNKKCIIML